MLDYINGNKFLEMADFAIDFDHKDFTMEMFKKNSILYCKTDFLPMLFNHLKLSGRKYILISHMSDIPITKQLFESKPKCIVKWFAENAVYKHPDLIPIPLGLENHKGTSKGKFTNHTWFVNNINLLVSKKKDPNVLYCNWNPDTNREQRGDIIPAIEKNGVKVHHETGLSFEQYCENMSNYMFVVCPPGNGVDTHRVWEALYMGCIPIVLDHHIFQGYNLPIMRVKSWSEVTLQNLLDTLNKPTGGAELFFSWWQGKIRDEFNGIH
jgi:hypothetical protein